MTKNKKILLIVGVVLLAVCVAVLLAFCGRNTGDRNQDADANADLEYTVQVQNAAGAALEDIGVYIYEDETLAELVWFDQTDAAGQMTFTAPQSDKYVAVLSDVPAGYATEDCYPLTGQLTQIVLAAGSMEDANPDELRYELGDVMADFTIVDTDGVEHTLSELLKEKKAVVLNFWYLECVPCKQEFPHMQEAYAQYQDDIEILAMNPVNTDEAAVAAFKKDLGLTFPMAVVDEAWAQIMQLTAYPTTVVIDRFGMVSLIHTGTIDNADTFTQMFEYFSAEDYVQGPIESLDQIATEEEGSEENPMQTGGDRTFEFQVGAGETYHFELYKITTKTYMTVYGEDFTLTYGGKSYSSTKGSVTLTIQAEGPSTPVKLSITNHTDKEQTYKVSLTAPKGSLANPYSISLGEFTMNTEAGNEQGVFATYTAEKDGTLLVRCLRSSVSRYGFYLYNLRSGAMRNADEDGQVDEDGYKYVSVQVKKGDQIQFSVAVARDDNNYISAGAFSFEMILEDGDGEEEKKPEPPKTTYTLQVTDEEGNPLKGVSVNLKGEFTYEPTEEDDEKLEATPVKVDLNLTTDDAGKISTEQVSGPYTATVRIPSGYTLEQTQYMLTAEAPAVTVTLKKILMKDYTVSLLYPNGDPVEGVAVMLGSDFKYTDAKGAASFNLAEGQYSVSFAGIPEGYVLPGNVTSVAFPAGESAMTLTLLAMGTEETPYEVTEFPFTANVAAGDQTYANFYYEATPVLTIVDPDAVVTYNGAEYTANAEGILEIPMAESTLDVPVQVIIGNAGEAEKSFEVQLVYPEGTKWNPEVIEDLTLVEADLAEGDEDGHYYQYTNENAGTLTVRVDAVEPEGAQYEVTVTTETDGTVSVQDTDVSVYAKADEQVLIYVRALPVVENPETDDETTGDETTGDETTGDETTGDETTGDETTGDETTGDETTDDETTGDETTGEEEVIVTIPAVKLQLVGSFEIDRGAISESEAFYTVTVEDYNGNPMPGVMVVYMLGDTQMGTMLTDSNGMTELKLEKAEYTVVLAVSGDVKYYYEQKDAVFHAGVTTLEIQLTSKVPGEAIEHWQLGTYQDVEVGSTYVTLQADVESYFVFTPTEQGVYRIETSDPDAVIQYWSGLSFPNKSDTGMDYTNNTYTCSVNTKALGQSHVIGISGAPDCILTITRQADAQEDIPYTPYELATEPKPYTLTIPDGKELVDVDLSASTDTYKLVLGSDGYLHIGSADGPIMYVRMNADARFISLYTMCGGAGSQTGTAFRCVYTDADGNLVKEDYTQCILDFGDCMDAATGVYPLTEDFMYILQMGGSYIGWYDSENENTYLFGDVENMNNDLAWMFACCYLK